MPEAVRECRLAACTESSRGRLLAASPAIQKHRSLLPQVDLQVDGQATNLRVGVRVRPILHHGVRASEAHQKDILRVQEGKRVVVLDPDEDKARVP